MKYIRHFFRLIHINYVLIKHGLDEIILTTPLFKPLKFLVFLSPSTWSNQKKIPRGIRIRKAIEELGPIFVKFGQIISTRLDVLPQDIAKELIKLQDKVPPFSSKIAKKFIEESLERKIDEIFIEFDEIPLASASISQVHAAKLPDGREVVIKVLRPNIHKQISQDIELFQILVRLASKYWKDAKRFKVKEILAEFKKGVFDELDLQREAANASQLRRNFRNSNLLYVPEIHWPYTKKNILVMERIYGIQVSNIEELKIKGIDLKILAEKGVEIFFTQVFRDCFFHADMHPGNIWVSTENPSDPKYIALDFGIVGTLGPEDQRYIAENVLAFFHRDYRRVAELHIESGWVPQSTRIDEFESAIRTVSEPIFERPLKEISFGKTLMRLLDTAKRFDMQIQPQLILLQKTLIGVEGLGRQLYPDLDLWKTAKPFLEDWMNKQLGLKAFIRKVKKQAPYWLEQLPELPTNIAKALHNYNYPIILEERKKLKSKQKSRFLPLGFGFILGAICTIGALYILPL